MASLEDQIIGAAERPISELDRLYAELTRVHDYISQLEHRLAPVIHHGLKQNAAAVSSQAVPTAENHITTAVSAANAAGNRLAELTQSLAV